MIAKLTDQEIQWAKQARINHPEITSYGFGKPRQYEDQWEGELTFHCLEMIAVCKRWLLSKKWRKGAGGADCPSSYSVKHWVESWKDHPPRSRTKYIYEGALILAAVELGVPYKRTSDWGIKLGLSTKQKLADLAYYS